MGLFSKLFGTGKGTSSSSSFMSSSKARTSRVGHVIGTHEEHVSNYLKEKYKQGKFLPKDEYERKTGRPGRKSPL